ncbi:MAG: hypothetical protein SVV03_03775 [Candidatus Nanohaloarchaea archaeon]|nr:hypothetical protein [Candidatus Nanohaloarchaea archaeon]
MSEEAENIPEDVYKIARYRLEAMPAHIGLMIGEKGNYNKEQLKEELKNRTEVGKTFARMQLRTLQSFKEI